MCCVFFLLIVGLYFLYKVYEYHKGKTSVENINNRYVLITGCDSGFGNALALLLDKKGVPVFAACLTEKGGTKLKNKTSSRLRVLQLDVTDQNSIHNAVEFVKHHLPKSSGLWGLVSNAGLQVLHAPLEFHSPEAVEKCLSVNLFGSINMTRSFLPLLRKEKGRLVYVTSECVFREQACRAPYVISKVGVESLAECLRRELYEVGVTIHTIQPGAFKTNIVEDFNEMKSILQRAFDAVDEEVQEFYGQHWLSKTKESCDRIPHVQCKDLSLVTNAIYHALFSVMPKKRYRCGPDCIYYFYPISLLPEWFNTWYWSMSPPPDAVTKIQKK
ncbi:retinol dehydrogenase 7-like [Saccostrea echinata]|uniref:retinol dehydrogenase 7-like n=1 Tax=Saccostrea echinata TaxID=191078 RepID=UPI002A7FA599|nr:retinol dehydrogenase 7-like [Saccostrea echinata]